RVPCAYSTPRCGRSCPAGSSASSRAWPRRSAAGRKSITSAATALRSTTPRWRRSPARRRRRSSARRTSSTTCARWAARISRRFCSRCLAASSRSARATSSAGSSTTTTIRASTSTRGASRSAPRSCCARRTNFSGSEAVMNRRWIGRAALVLACVGLARSGNAEWLQPDASYRDSQINLRLALRDTVGHPDDPGRLDSLGIALLRLARLDEAARVFDRVAELSPSDPSARAARGKLALFADQPAVAESLLTGLETNDPDAAADLFSARIRRAEYSAAADTAPLANQEGRRALLTPLSERAPYAITAGPDRAVIPFERGYPVVLVKLKLNGQLVVMAVDTGVSDMLIDDSAARRYKVQPIAGQSVVFWSGSRNAVKNAVVQRLELGGFRVENCPAGILSLGRWSLEANPGAERVAGVIGLNLLRRFSPTIDYDKYK